MRLYVPVRMGPVNESLRTRYGGCMKRRAKGTGRHPLYGIYRAMLDRCYNTNTASYPLYGERGITVSERWSGPGGFDRWLEDVGERPPDPPGWTGRRHFYSLDRIDNDGNYEPGNVRWATPQEQRANRRTAVRRKPLKTHCVRGHALTEENINIDRNGNRHCRECNKIRIAEYHARQGVI